MGVDADLVVKGFVPALDDEWEQHKTIFSTCQELGIDPPTETAEYFEDLELVEDGGLVDLATPVCEFVTADQTHEDERYVDLQTPGYCDVDLGKIPSRIKRLRIYIKVSC